jgi:hypothetical protein
VRARARGRVPRGGAPEGGFQTLLVGSARVEGLIADPRVAAVTLTGSEGAGAAVGAAAGRALKPTVLELGGSDPFVVLPTADLDAAARTAVTARTINNGQSCIAAKRFVVHAAVYDAFVAQLADGMRALRVGDPMDDATQVGPLASAQTRDDVADQVRRTVAAGARLVCGGAAADGPGFYYPPTVLADVTPDMPAAAEETFGPVAAVLRAADADDALRLANATPYGLGASVWTRDDAEAARFEAGVDAGAVFFNAQVVSDPRLPFGGVKRSGYGRELADVGLRAFVNVKTVRVAPRGGDPQAAPPSSHAPCRRPRAPPRRTRGGDAPDTTSRERRPDGPHGTSPPPLPALDAVDDGPDPAPRDERGLRVGEPPLRVRRERRPQPLGDGRREVVERRRPRELGGEHGGPVAGVRRPA